MHALLDYLFATLLLKNVKGKEAHIDAAFERMTDRPIAAITISWANYTKNEPLGYKNIVSIGNIERLRSIKLHNIAKQSVDFKYSKRKELFETTCTVRLVETIDHEQAPDTHELNNDGCFLVYRDQDGKDHKKLIFPNFLEANEIVTVGALRAHFENLGTVKEIRLMEYEEMEGEAMNNESIANFKKSAKEKLLLHKSKQNKAKSKQNKSSNIIKGKQKEDGGYCMMFCILFAIVIMFGMAYMASTFDIKEEDYWANYALLGLSESATLTDVTKRFRELSKLYHPDKNPNCVDCAAKFAQINSASTAIKKRLKMLGRDTEL